MTTAVSRLAVAVLAAALSLAGCAGLPDDNGRADVQALLAERGYPPMAGAPGRDAPLDAAERAALSAPLTPAAAVSLALRRNPALRRELARLGFAAAEVHEAGRLANPQLGGSLLLPVVDPTSAGAQYGLSLAIDFANLISLPARRRLARAQFEATRQAVAAAAIDLAGEVEAAWVRAAAAAQLAAQRRDVAAAQQVAARLAQRYFEAGNLSPRQLSTEQAAASQALLAALAAQAQAEDARLALQRLLALPAGQGELRIGHALASLPASDPAVAGLLDRAQQQRLDLQAARAGVEALAERYGLVRRLRWIDGLQVGASRQRDSDGVIGVGPTLSFELPLFDWGRGRTLAAQAALDSAEAELDTRLLDVDADLHRAAARLADARSRHALVRDALLPQREAVLAEAGREQAWMLIGVFELIVERQQRAEAEAGAIEALRDYWLARADLARASGGPLPDGAQPLGALLPEPIPESPPPPPARAVAPIPSPAQPPPPPTPPPAPVSTTPPTAPPMHDHSHHHADPGAASGAHR